MIFTRSSFAQGPRKAQIDSFPRRRKYCSFQQSIALSGSDLDALRNLWSLSGWPGSRDMAYSILKMLQSGRMLQLRPRDPPRHCGHH
jgi:hypothetical protein